MTAELQSRRNAVTLVELLVVISVIGVLVSLAIPAVQFARESARRAACSNNGRQIGLAIQQHVGLYGLLPTNGGLYDRGFNDREREIGLISTTDHLNGSRLLVWGVGRPHALPQEQSGSWAFAILPFLEQQVAYDAMATEQWQPAFACVTRGRELVCNPQDQSYAAFADAGLLWAKTDFAGNEWIIRSRRLDPLGNANPDDAPPLRLAHLRDGSSQTLVAGEKSYNELYQHEESWYWDEPIFSGGSNGTVRSGFVIRSDGPRIQYKNTWGAPHRGAGVFVLADGSVRTLDKVISGSVMRALLHPADGAARR